MSTGDEKQAASEADASAQLSLEFNLAPAWARTSPEDHQRRYADDARGGREEARRFGGGRGAPREGGRDRRPGGPRPGGPGRGGPRPDSRDARRFDDRRGHDRRSEFRPVREEPPQPLPLDVRILPDQKALGAVIRRIQTTHRAYPLRDIALLFLDNPAAHQFRIEPLKGQVVPLFQCRVCGMPGLSEEEIRAHVLATHLEDFFEVSEVETEPPAGNFVCVARCGISGELLGPPNHHSFNARVQEMLRTRFASMSEVDYRSRIVMVRDPEVVNAWRESCRKKRVYRRKRATPAAPAATEAPDASAEAPAEGAAAPAAPASEASTAPEVPASPALDRQAAELQFLREILPAQILAVKHMVCPAVVARQAPNRRLIDALRDAFHREERFPASLFFALRGAFRHRALHLFRAGSERGPDFVVVHAPVGLDATHVVAELRDVLDYINQHPGCTRQELLGTLAAGDEARAARYATQLNTLVEKAHVIEYFNGVLAPPATHPVFQAPSSGRKPAAPRAGPKAGPQAGVPAAEPAAEEPAPAKPTPAAAEQAAATAVEPDVAPADAPESSPAAPEGSAAPETPEP